MRPFGRLQSKNSCGALLGLLLSGIHILLAFEFLFLPLKICTSKVFKPFLSGLKMVKGLTHYLRQAWKNPDAEMMKTRMIEWRASDAVVKLEKPMRLDRARALGYKDKKGFVVFRVRVKRGGRTRPTFHMKGRKSRKQSNRKILKMNYKWVAEIRAERRYNNLEVLNSYFIGKDGKHYYFEVIMVDPSRPEIKNDPVMKWIADKKNHGRAQRGLTSAARKSRGLRSKSHELKVRQSLRAWNRRGK